jgi:hypothetical protein
MQSILVILLVAACGLWLGYQGYRHFKPKASGGFCAGGCCAGEAKRSTDGAAGQRTMMVSAEDLRNRVKARK